MSPTGVPEVVEAGLAPCLVRSAVLDGEAIALRADGRPKPFQVTGSDESDRRSMSRAGTIETPLTLYAFDGLAPRRPGLARAPRRRGAFTRLLAAMAPKVLLVPRLRHR